MEFKIQEDAKVVPHKRHWQFCVGSGHALLALRTDYMRQLKFIHDELGIQYVRFHGIFNDDMHTKCDMSMLFPIPGTEEFKEQNFHACGVAYDNVLAAGMKPFVEIGFMPKNLASGDAKCMFYYGGNVTPPADYEAWNAYVCDFIQYLEHRYGAEEVRTWYFEVWNEPDLNPIFFAGTKEDYFRLYENTAWALKSVDEKLKVGGPATSGSKWVGSFVRYCREHQVPLDFVSTHQYAGDPLGGVEDDAQIEEYGAASVTGQDGTSGDERAQQEAMQEYIAGMMAALAGAKEKTFLEGLRAIMPDKSELIDIPNDVFLQNAPVVKRQADGLPVYYTEWNENATFGAYTNDTRKVAAYDVKTALDVADDVDGSSIWCFSDIFEELHPFPQEFHGGFGMLTKDGVPKPVFYAMKLLAAAGDERIDLGEDATKGEIGIAAFVAPGEKQVLLFRQKMKNLILSKEKAEVSVEMSAAPQRVTVQRIDEEHCNPLRLWEEAGCPADLNHREIAELVERSRMREEEWPYSYEDGILKITAELGVNDIYYIRIIF